MGGMNNGQMMRHFGVALLGDAKNEQWVRLSFETVRDMVARAWDEGYQTSDAAWAETWDLVTPDEDRTDPRNPYRNGGAN